MPANNVGSKAKSAKSRIKMPIKLFSNFFGSKHIRDTQPESDKDQAQIKNADTPLRFRSKEFIELGSFLSNANPNVIRQLELFINEKNDYVAQYEHDLLQRGIEDSSELFPELVLIDSLILEEKIAYVDHATEGHHVLTMLDHLANGALSKDREFDIVRDIYQSKGRYNTIGNFIDHNDFSPRPQSLTQKSGFHLISIDDGSDSYALILVQSNDLSKFKSLVSKAGIKAQYFTT
jgi:hypothetical protein